jgi:hypothetical protein
MKAIDLVQTNALPGQEAEFNEWYEKIHLGDILAVPGIATAQRFRLSPVKRGGNYSTMPAPFQYLAIYEFTGETNDVLDGIEAARTSGEDPVEQGTRPHLQRIRQRAARRETAQVAVVIEAATPELRRTARGAGRPGEQLEDVGRRRRDRTLNYITPAKIAEACRLAVSGRVIALGVPLDRKDGPQVTAPRRYNPIHFMDELPADYVCPARSVPTTCWFFRSKRRRSGTLSPTSRTRAASTAAAAQVRQQPGASRNSIRGISDKVNGRGVLIDLPRHFGVDALAPGQIVTASDLDAALDREHVAVGTGDIVLVRTGFMQLCRARAWVGYHGDAPGLGVETATWLHEHEIAAVATDTASLEAKPWTLPGIGVPFHAVALTHMGLLLGEIFDLDALAEDCARDGRYEFLFVEVHFPSPAGVGSYVNPYAIK